jgi:hypothetical protein
LAYANQRSLQLTIAVGLLIVLHGLVHFLYVGQALRWFELREGMAWPVGARSLSTATDTALKISAAITIGVSSLALVLGGVGIAVGVEWGQPITLVAAALLSFLHILFWDGNLKTFPEQGLYGIIINVVIVLWIAIG